MSALGILALMLAAFPAGLGIANLIALRPPRTAPLPPELLVSILIPARNEARNIGAALSAARASRGVRTEIVVMDDGSTDDTARIARAHAAADPRVRLEAALPPPPGWAGKNHACQQLADKAHGTHLLFVDADVRLEPLAAAGLAAHAHEGDWALVSGVPRQIMRGLGELLTVPMINFLLLGYLPLARMRATSEPSLGAACGQLLLVERRAYEAVGGHAAIAGNIHDALALVRAFRARNLRTDLLDGSGLASCRMYASFDQAWAGFLKNAHEGMAKPIALPVWTVLLFGGHVLPLCLLIAGGGLLPLAALLLSLGLRLAISLKARESLLAVPLHPFAILTALAIQWTALVRARLGRPTAWKGRVFHAG